MHSKSKTFCLHATTTILLVLTLSTGTANALITGGKGNEPLSNRGWPDGADVIFNNAARIAWWEGPPFGGGRYHAEYRGDAKTLNALLVQFAKLKVETKRVIVHDGVGSSFWLNPNGQPENEEASEIDFRFMVWNRENWLQLSKLPADLNPIAGDDLTKGPPAQIDIYTGGRIEWLDIHLPKGVDVTDNRLVANGFNESDGMVLDGKVEDIETNQPLNATIQLELIEPRKTGGYEYSFVAETSADKDGRFVMKNAPAGWHRIIAKADGYAPRTLGHIRSEGQPSWNRYDAKLAKSASISGHVVDASGNPLAGVKIRLSNVAPKSGGRYQSPVAYNANTKADGSFYIEDVPAGSASVGVSKVGYCRPGLRPSISIPSQDVKIQMMRSAFVRVTVDFKKNERPKSYIVNLEPEGGSAVGKWGGSGNIDENNEMIFKDVPPGRYEVFGHPNPTSEKQKTERIAFELKGGKTKRLILTAK